MKEIKISEVSNVSGGMMDAANMAHIVVNIVKDILPLFDRHKGMCQCFDGHKNPIADRAYSQQNACIHFCCIEKNNPQGFWVLRGSHRGAAEDGYGLCGYPG